MKNTNTHNLTREQIATDPDLLVGWIKFQLHIHDSSFAAIGRKYGVTGNAVRSACRKRYPKMERAIAAELGLTPQEIWPERYPASLGQGA